METTRQKKVSKLLQKDVAEILQTKIKKEGNYGILLSVTKVSVTVDFSLAKVFLSIFPSEMSKQILDEVLKMSPRIRHEIAQKAKKQLRKVPELLFFLDDSLDYIEKIEDSLKGLDNPLRK
ncbi:MAG: ribosome-binding factor A [Flavobacteriaceae bacterium]|nr:ribosome-binding factor A [Flavobacteriaceae bacterium]|tara:strand:- start:15567 stop:15929 length:363 start_codon:yes stop_codon:yes gene_type:complete